jgi:KaiC/GvpD/RAD55 family RecA-like ATPase
MRSRVAVTHIGRMAEVSRVQRLLAGLPHRVGAGRGGAGRGGALVLVGAPGIGKTALSEAAVDLVVAR